MINIKMKDILEKLRRIDESTLTETVDLAQYQQFFLAIKTLKSNNKLASKTIETFINILKLPIADQKLILEHLDTLDESDLYTVNCGPV